MCFHLNSSLMIMNGEWTRKEEFVTYLTFCPRICMKGLRKTATNQVKVAGIRSQDSK
jgi:hypothetical protein